MASSNRIKKAAGPTIDRLTDNRAHPQSDLIADYVEAAFHLYDAEWNGVHALNDELRPRHDISQWDWPLTCVEEGNYMFDGRKGPWAVLLRQAAQLVLDEPVIVRVRGGVAQDVNLPRCVPVRVRIVDYDNNAVDDDPDLDENGEPCIMTEYTN